MIIRGDCIEEMKKLEENSVDAIVTDPPYGLEFMGKNWDKGVPGIPFWKEMIRVLKPGGFLLSFGGTRTYHRLVCGIEDAGFEIRDCIQWLYGSGFPKSLNIGKQIDKIQGNVREVVGKSEGGKKLMEERPWSNNPDYDRNIDITKGTSEWEGWGTALKPANEPIVVARKPLSEKNVALNVLKWGTGGINIDECRIGNGEDKMQGGEGGFKKEYVGTSEYKKVPRNTQGRFPANIILDEEAGKILDEQSGVTKSSPDKRSNEILDNNVYSEGWKRTPNNINDKGGASRFFYCAKASKSERNLGCDEFEEKAMCEIDKMGGSKCSMKTGSGNERNVLKKNNHPTVKPIKLMEYLIKLVSKEGAVVLDPFLGSGTTAIACQKLNRKWIGIEKEEEYVKICEARIKPFLEQQTLDRGKTQ